MKITKFSKTVGLTTFHGTNAENIPNIIEKGLLAKSPIGAPHAAKAIYLTNNIETAARYCRDFEKPVILEIYISSPKRVNKLIQDPLDMDESLYENYDNEPFFMEDINYLERLINKIFDINSYLCPIDFPNEIEGFRNFDLYGVIKDFAKSKNLDLNKIKKKIKELLPPQDLDYLRINESGFISLLPSVYDTFHQMYYRKDLPASTIKAIWIPKNKLKLEVSEGKEEKSFGRRLIPADIRSLQNLINRFQSKFWHHKEQDCEIELEDMDEVIENLDEEDSFGLLKEDNKWGLSFINELKLLRNDFKNALEDDKIKIKSLFYEKFLNMDPLDPGEIASVEIWVKFPVNLNSLNNIESLYKKSNNNINKIVKLASYFYNLSFKIY